MTPSKTTKNDRLDSEFIDLLTEIGLGHGLDRFTSKLCAILYSEPGELTAEDLRDKTGYSLASISNSMKVMEMHGFLKTTKQPKSKKIYYSMGKDFTHHALTMLERIETSKIRPAKEKLPVIIKEYQAGKIRSDKQSRDKLQIMENYYMQVCNIERVLKFAIKELSETK